MPCATRQLSPFAVLALFLLAAGCGSSSDEDPAPTPPGNTAPYISVADATLVEGDSGASDLEFSVTLSVAASLDVSVDYSTADGTATAGEDYTSASGTLTIAAGATTGTIVVPVLGDTEDEIDETLTVTLSNASTNANIQRAQATGTISDDDPPPTLDISDATLSEGDTGTSILSFQISLSGSAASDVSVDYASSDVTAVAGEDYAQVSGTAIITAGDLNAIVDVSITGDTDFEPDETFEAMLSNVSASATLGRATAIGTILNDDSNATPSASALNDTGVTTCSDASNNGLTCNDAAAGTDQFPGQDAENGRDVTDSFDGDGYAGFVFTKLDSNGVPLPDQAIDYATTPWRCVLDGVTRLWWEVKTDSNDLHGKNWTYSWYDSDAFIPGISNGGQCDSNRDCDTEKFAMAANAATLCGFDDWRVPSRHELLSLMHFGATAPPYIDTDVFVNHALYPYWSASLTPDFSAAYVNFSEYGANTATPIESYAVRLVRGE
ncbi:MAG: Calx-beta domain-containing protein [Woeseiaceae bacterium]